MSAQINEERTGRERSDTNTLECRGFSIICSGA